jgi:hypothetical protein
LGSSPRAFYLRGHGEVGAFILRRLHQRADSPERSLQRRKSERGL